MKLSDCFRTVAAHRVGNTDDAQRRTIAGQYYSRLAFPFQPYQNFLNMQPANAQLFAQPMVAYVIALPLDYRFCPSARNGFE
jgi:hypothetical protein